MFAPCTTPQASPDAYPTVADIEARIDAWLDREGGPEAFEPDPVCERPTPMHRLRRMHA